MNTINNFYINSSDLAKNLIKEQQGDSNHQSDMASLSNQISLRHQESLSEPVFRDNLADLSSKIGTFGSGDLTIATKPLPPQFPPNGTGPLVDTFAKELETFSNQLEKAADDLKAKYDNPEVGAFEKAAGKVARAAEEVRENPGSEDAIEEFETVTDELKNTAHDLKGAIDDTQYQKITSAVDKFETSTDHMLAADDGEADMAGAIFKTNDALELLVAATAGDHAFPGNDDVPSDPYQELNSLVNKINSLIITLMDKLGIKDDDAEPIEEMMEELQDAVKAFKKDQTSESSIEGLMKKAAGLEKALGGLENKVDENTYKSIPKDEVADLKEAIDKLAGLDGKETEINKVTPEIVQHMKAVAEAMEKGIDGDKSIVEEPDFGPPVTKPEQGQLAEILKKLNEFVDDGGVSSVTEPDFGPPVTKPGQEELAEILNSLKKMLDDGGVSSVTEPDFGPPVTKPEQGELAEILKKLNEFVDSTHDDFRPLATKPSPADETKVPDSTIDLLEEILSLLRKETDLVDTVSTFPLEIDEDNAILAEVLNDGSTTGNTTDETTLGTAGEVALSDGSTTGQPAVPAASIPEDPKDILKPQTLADLENATDNLRSSSDNLAATFNTTDLDAFVTDTVELEIAGNDLLRDPSQVNIDAFLGKTADLSSSLGKLKDKIDPELHEQLSALVGTFETSVQLANELSSDPDRLGKLVAVAVLNLDGLSSLIDKAVENKEAETEIA